MSMVLRALGLDDARWSQMGPRSLSSAVIVAVGSAVLMAFNRFGGLAVETPRAFLRMTLIGVYGWLALALGIWLLSRVALAVTNQPASGTRMGSAQQTLIAVGLAHTPLLMLGFVIFAAAGLLQVLGPGRAVAFFVFGFWFPAVLVMAARSSLQVPLVRAAAIVALPYVIWLVLIGRYLLRRVEHLL